MRQKVYPKTRFAGMINRYIDYMQNKLGRKFKTEKYILYAFDNFIYNKEYDGELSEEIFLQYCMTGNITLTQRGKRYRILFKFYEFYRIYNEGLPPISRQPISAKNHKYIAYFYTPEDMSRILGEIRNDAHTNKSSIYRWQCAIGILACTGLRVSELLNLKLTDIDWGKNILTIRKTKFYKSRLVPVQENVIAAIRKYLPFRNSLPSVDNVFVTTNGKAWNHGSLNYKFNRILRSLKIGTEAVNKPRLHDLRHSFAVNRIIKWQKQGKDIQQLLPILSTYMGHSRYEYTTYYLESHENILRAAVNKFRPLGGSEK